MMPGVILPIKYRRKFAKAFNLYEIVEAIDHACFLGRGYDEQAVLLNKRNGEVLHINRMPGLENLIVQKVNLGSCAMVYSGELIAPENPISDEICAEFCKQYARFLPKFSFTDYLAEKEMLGTKAVKEGRQSWNHEKTNIEELFDNDEAWFWAADERIRFEDTLDIFAWCQENQIPLMQPDEARMAFHAQHNKGLFDFVEIVKCAAKELALPKNHRERIIFDIDTGACQLIKPRESSLYMPSTDEIQKDFISSAVPWFRLLHFWEFCPAIDFSDRMEMDEFISKFDSVFWKDELWQWGKDLPVKIDTVITIWEWCEKNNIRLEPAVFARNRLRKIS
jgi:hypothetical protein